MWLEPLNANEITCKAYYDHLPTPVDHAVFYKKQNEVTKLLLTEKDVLVREEVKKKRGEKCSEVLSLLFLYRFIKMQPMH